MGQKSLRTPDLSHLCVFHCILPVTDRRWLVTKRHYEMLNTHHWDHCIYTHGIQFDSISEMCWIGEIADIGFRVLLQVIIFLTHDWAIALKKAILGHYLGLWTNLWSWPWTKSAKTLLSLLWNVNRIHLKYIVFQYTALLDAGLWLVYQVILFSVTDQCSASVDVAMESEESYWN